MTERAALGKERSDGNHRYVPGYEDVNRTPGWSEQVTYKIVGYACDCTPRHHNRGRGDWKEGREVEPELGNDDWTTPGNGTPRKPPEAVAVPEWQFFLEPTPLAVNVLGAMLSWTLDWQPAPTTPAVVLDPFGGTGTTSMVARALGRIGISNDLSHDYSKLARWRIFHSGGAAKVVARTLQDRQGSLF